MLKSFIPSRFKSVGPLVRRNLKGEQVLSSIRNTRYLSRLTDIQSSVVLPIRKNDVTERFHQIGGSTRNASSPSAAYNQTIESFPSIVIGADGLISPQGSFAEAQAQVRGMCLQL